MVEVTLLAHASPYNLGGVGEGVGNAIDAGEGEAGVAGEVFHEYDAHLIVADGGEIPLAVLFVQQFSRFGTVVKGFERDVFGDGGHQAVGVTFVVKVGVLVLRCPDV